MKKPTKKAAPVAVAKSTPKTSAPKVVIPRVPVDVYLGYNSEGRFPKTEVTSTTQKAAFDAKPKFTRSVFVISKGTKGLLAYAALTDEKGEFYSRKSGDKDAIGHLPTLNALEKSYKVEVLTTKELLTKLLHGKAKTQLFKSRATGEEVQVVLLNPSTDSYFVGVTLDDKGHLRVINMEPVARYNKKNVQWVLLRDIADGKLVGKLTNYTHKSAKAVLSSK